MEMFNFYLENTLRPVFEDPKLIQEESTDDEIEREDGARGGEGDIDHHSLSIVGLSNHLDNDNRSTTQSSGRMSSSRRGRGRRRENSLESVYIANFKRKGPEDILDLQGPKLMQGCRMWVLFYQLIGQLNWLGVPFYLSIIYKLLLITFICYIIHEYFIKALLNTSIVDLTYRNPIFVFIGFLAILSTVFNGILAFYTNLFNLCPLFKVLTTPKLCFISEEVQHIVGTKTIRCCLLFYIYHTFLMVLLVHTDLNEFVDKFNIGRFLIFLFCSICGMYHFIGLSHIDWYIRACFASWLIALKGNLEYRFAHLHRHQRLHRLHMNQRAARLMATNAATAAGEGEDDRQQDEGQEMMETVNRRQSMATMQSIQSSSDKQQQVAPHQMTLEEFKEKYKIVTLDEIQKNLNAMDDHLEVWRSIQTSSLVLISLNAFLTNGALLLLAYNLLANRGNYYHGFLLILLVTNYTILIFFCYIGDSWLYHALSSFVQTVEDEYFLQGGADNVVVGGSGGSSSNGGSEPLVARSNSRQGSLPAANNATEPLDLSREHQLLLIKKKDVLFCREFLHQFENHLATPWSKLTVKVHLRMVGTFVTLIAAQIIFDHEH